jgi:hypothetical protein
MCIPSLAARPHAVSPTQATSAPSIPQPGFRRFRSTAASSSPHSSLTGPSPPPGLPTLVPAASHAASAALTLTAAAAAVGMGVRHVAHADAGVGHATPLDFHLQQLDAAAKDAVSLSSLAIRVAAAALRECFELLYDLLRVLQVCGRTAPSLRI